MANRKDFDETEAQLAYEFAKKVYGGERGRIEASNELIERLSTKKGTVDAFFAAYSAMRSGIEYNRALGNSAVECFVKGIARDEGPSGRALALQAVMLNIEYYERSNKAANGHRVFRRDQRALHARLLSESAAPATISPDEFDGSDSELVEGALRTVYVNQYERNPDARRQSIAHYGCKCYVCAFDFERHYGAIGRWLHSRASCHRYRLYPSRVRR